MKTGKLEMDAFKKYGLKNTLKIKIKGGLTDGGLDPNDLDGDGIPDDPTNPGGPGGSGMISTNIKIITGGQSPQSDPIYSTKP